MRRNPLQRWIAASLALAGSAALFTACSDGGGTTEPPPAATGSISGQVAAGGTGVAAATLSLTQGSTTLNATSAATGAFSFTNVAAGAWTLAVTPPTGFTLAAGQAGTVPVTVSAGQTTTVNIALAATAPAGPGIRATVTAGGEPRSDVPVRLYDADATTPRATLVTNLEGHATFTGLAAGAYDVEVAPPAGFQLAPGEQARKRVTVGTGQATVSFALQQPTGPTVQVGLSGFSFTPASLTVAVGTTVRWVNQDGALHTVTPDGHSAWSTATLTGVGQTFSQTFTAPGTFNYYCDPHRSAGMTGVVRVQ
jgi:plastocyanin